MIRSTGWYVFWVVFSLTFMIWDCIWALTFFYKGNVGMGIFESLCAVVMAALAWYWYFLLKENARYRKGR